MRYEILLAEDHAIVRDGLRALLAGEPDLVVVGEATNGHDAIILAREKQPQLILMDLSMPRKNGTEAIRDIKRRAPEIRIIALTAHRTQEYVRAALRAGADGYVLKDDTQIELLVAIRSVLRGKTYLSPGVAHTVVTEYLNTSEPAGGAAWDTLSPREREVIKLIAEGARNKDVARLLCLSEKTVEKHRSNLMKKLDLHTASHLTAYAIENGLASP